MSNLPYDPKWPDNKPSWDEEYAAALPKIRDRNSPWHHAFSEIMTADEKGEFNHLRSFYKQNQRESGLWVWRGALWELHCKPIFNQDSQDWPAYAKAVFKAAKETFQLATPGDVGRTEGIPEEWRSTPLRVWSFKATVLHIAGLIEGEFRLTPKELLEFIKSFVDEKAPTDLKSTLLPLVGDLGRESLFQHGTR